MFLPTSTLLVAVVGGVWAAPRAPAFAPGTTAPPVTRNRTEYEQTLHDLLAIHTPLSNLLPEDGSAFGFVNIGAALNTSSQLMERYLEAADVALQAAMIDGPRPQTTTQTFSFIKEQGVA